MQYSSLIGHSIELFDEIKKFDHPTDRVISKYYELKRYLGSNDRSFITESVYDLMRNLSKIEHLVKISLDTYPQYKENIPTILLFFGLFIYRSAEYETSDKTFYDIFKEKLGDVDINSLIAVVENNILQLDAVGFDVKYSFQPWMVQKLSGVVKNEELENLLDSLNKPAPTTIRVVGSKTSKGRLKEILEKKKKVEVEKTMIAPEGLTISKRINFQEMEEFKRGLFEVQDEGSQVVTLLTEVKPGMVVLDVCAGGGGKTIYMSELMKNAGKIFAFDIDKDRIKNLGKRIKDKNFKNINVVKVKTELKYFVGTFDVVLVDAPCTGSGTIRRNPDLKWRIKEKDIVKYTNLQLEILNEYAQMVKMNGSLVYVTCSLFKEENEDVINKFLESKPNFAVANLAPILKSNDIKNLEVVSDFDNLKYLHLFPYIHKTDGFFGCVLKREK
jgi:16S rRNA (cytosine967-C5)-methyltransferase